MIKFFRKIRQNMIKENRASKYMLYAIGEIVLVVIGILFALQINNWNIERLERKNEKMILLDLQVEFQENLVDAERVKKGNDGIFNAMSAIQQNSVEKNYNQEIMDSLMYYVFDWFDYTPKPGASNNLINSGNLNLISNKELRKLLTLWSGVAAELDDDEQLAVRYSQDIIIPYIVTRYPMSNLESFDKNVGYYLKDNNNLEEFEPIRNKSYNVEGLLQDNIFNNHISVKKMYARHNALECVNVVNTCRSILDIIEQELGQSSL